MKRPRLSSALTADEFSSWYWLKEELVAFCREQNISPTGSKLELQARIGAHLGGCAQLTPPSPSRRSGSMPTEFTLDTVIGEGWRCNPALGAFMRGVAGRGFRFNAEMREFIHNGRGMTLADAAIRYRTSMQPCRKKKAIPAQLEYNRHIRDYFSENPHASRQEAIAAWWAKRSTRIEHEWSMPTPPEDGT